MQPANFTPHTLPIETIRESFATGPDGLTKDEAKKRLADHGPNLLREGKRRPIWAMIVDQYRDPMILLLLVAAAISGVIGEGEDAIAILVIVVLNSIIGFIQEFRAERAMAALLAMAAPNATVRRDGQILTIPAREVVPGDIVLLEAGKVVPADLRLMELRALKVDESPLTGESVPVEKYTRVITDPGASVGDRFNMVHKGTTVTYGSAVGVVSATGMDTEMGRIAGLLDSAVTVKTPLQKRLARVSRNLAVAAIIICMVVFIAGVMQGEGLLRMFLTAVSLAVAAVPEALPAVVTISLALGARQMVMNQALIRRLPAVETLGSVTSICTDKTGTLTENRMRVELMVDRDLKPVVRSNQAPMLVLALAVSNEVRRDAADRPLGDPTEIALYEKAAELGMRKEDVDGDYPLEGMVPFSSERQMMTTLHRTPTDGWLAITKGGMEAVIACCPDLDLKTVESEHQRMAAAGLRVLAFAYRSFEEKPANISEEGLEQNLTFLGLTGAMDPPRPEAADAVAVCKGAGIRPVMITGDHPLTAHAIARRLGIIDNDHKGVVTGRELAAMEMDTFTEAAAGTLVYARVAPEQKLKIITALQTRGEAAAMTGDGVNDAPALKQADIGVAMGINGTDVAKEAADMVLLDDNFASIVRAVREGRIIYDNIRKFIKYTLTSNTGEIWTIFLAPFLGMPIPLLPIHILWINLATDGAPGLALTVEPGESDIMERPPRPLTESLFAHGMWLHILWVGLLMGSICLGLQAWGIRQGEHWQTMVFTALCMSQFGHALAIRSENQSLFSLGLFSNPFLFGTVVVSIAVQMAIIYQPVLQRIFHTQPLSFLELALTCVVSTLVFWGVEIEKWWKRNQKTEEI